MPWAEGGVVVGKECITKRILSAADDIVEHVSLDASPGVQVYKHSIGIDISTMQRSSSTYCSTRALSCRYKHRLIPGGHTSLDDTLAAPNL